MHASNYGRGIVLNTIIDAPKYDTKDYMDVSVIESIAVENDIKGALTIFVVNRDMEDGIELECTIAGYEGYKIKEYIVLDGDDVKASNTRENPNRVVPRNLDNAKIDGETLFVNIPKLSWNVIRLEK